MNAFRAYGRLDILVLNGAGRPPAPRPMKITDAQWREWFDHNESPV